jgi:GrpB-like predicted nucleotidyltransferase (UPF0157 family)/GNAT superfamily N-acetyltransferase
MSNKKIEIVQYNPEWPLMYENEVSLIKPALGDNLISIHHVGSTSVPGLAAKPKIDMIAEVKTLTFPDNNLQALGYTYRGGFNLPLRKSYTKRIDALSVNLHIFEQNDPEIELNLKFRDYLRKFPEARDKYQALKYRLIQEEASHQKQGAMYTGYTLGKHDLIHQILKETGFNRLRFVICTHYSEWETAKNFRQKYFFGKVGIQDPYHWTFDHPGHKHLALYLGTEIIGYAHILLWPEQRAALRIIVIDEDKRNNHYGGQFLNLCEKWLKNEGFKSFHAESSPAAINFYRKNGYTEMPFNDPDGYKGDPQDIAVGKIL